MAAPSSTTGLLSRARSSDALWSLRSSPLTLGAAILTVLLSLAALLAPWIAPYDSLDLSTANLLDARLPPAWSRGGSAEYLLGTDAQGRDLFSLILFGTRTSLAAGFLAMGFATVVGVTLGLVSGYVGGVLDAAIMRLADVQLSFPAILLALLIDGIVRGLVPSEAHERMALAIIVVSIGLANWAHFARTVRGSTLIEKGKEYVQAARIIGLSRFAILRRHILINVMEPVLVIATVGFGIAIIMEATLSFLGVGLPPTQPSLGTLIRIGSDYLFSGYWWMTIFPGVTLLLLVLAINLLGDWLRDVVDPTMR